MRNLVKKIFGFLGHFAALTGISLVLYMAGAFFLYNKGLAGVDSSHFLYYVIEFSSRKLTWPPAGWKMDHYAGMAQMIDNPYLSFLLIQPLVKLWGSLMATKIFLVFFLFLFVWFSYLFFWELSGSILLSAALAVALARSYSIYIQLYSAGVALSFCTQAALPASLYFLLRFIKKRKRGWMVLAIIATSVGFYIHPLMGFFFIFPFSFLFLLFYPPEGKEKFFNKQKLKDVFFYSLMTLWLSASAYVPFLTDFFQGGQMRRSPFVAMGHASDLSNFFKATHWVFYLFLPVAVIGGILLGSFKKKIKIFLAIAPALVYVLVFQITCSWGINPLIGQIFPHRLFWPLPLFLGGLMAVFWGGENKEWIRKAGVGFLAVSLLITSFWNDLPTYAKENKRLEEEYALGLESLLTGKVPKYKTENLPVKIEDISEWRYKAVGRNWDTSDLNYRCNNFTSRTGWNMFFEMPQIHGYYHYRTYRADQWYSWLYTVFSRENFEAGGVSPEIAKQQSLFLADWYAIRYIASEDGKEAEIAPHFYEEGIPYVLSKENPKDLLAKEVSKAPARLELSPDYISEIARPVRQPVIGFVGQEQAYDYFLRNLGMLNLNSQYLIPIRLANFVEDLRPKLLEGIDGLVVYNFEKRGKSETYQEAWGKLRGYLEAGGVILIDSGAEGPEKWGEAVPEIFPMTKFESGSLGKIWQIESDFFEENDFVDLSPLTYQDGIWSVSFLSSERDLKAGARVLLRQAGKAVIVEQAAGRGKLIWSGLNLFYRPLHHEETALAEVELIEKLLTRMFPLKKEEVGFVFSRPTPERVILEFKDGRGVLFKENDYGGWVGVALADGKKVKLPVLAAGPDFMYAPLPEELWDQSVKVEFIYRGLWNYWLTFILGIVALLFLLDYLLLSQKIANLFFLPLKKKIFQIRKLVKKKWEEE